MLLKEIWLKNLLKKHALQLLSIYALTIVFNTFGYMGGKYQIEWLYNFEFSDSRIYGFTGIFAIYYAVKHLKDKTFAFTLLWKKRYSTVLAMLSWVAVVWAMSVFAIEILNIINYLIYSVFDMLFNLKSQPVGSLIRTIANITIADAIMSKHFIVPFFIANLFDKLFDKGIVDESGEKLCQRINAPSPQKRHEFEDGVIIRLLLYFTVLPFMAVLLGFLVGYRSDAIQNLLFYFAMILQLLYIFVLGFNGSYVGRVYVVISSLMMLFELKVIQLGIELGWDFIGIISMCPRLCGEIFKRIMNYFMQGGFDDISRYHSYLYLIPGLIIFISIYVLGVLGHILQKKFAKTVDKSL